jgi:hypothetical protein
MTPPPPSAGWCPDPGGKSDQSHSHVAGDGFIKLLVMLATLVGLSIRLACPANAVNAAYVRTEWGLRCLVTDYDEAEGAPLATCEIPSLGQDLAQVGAAGDFKWNTGNIGGVGVGWDQTDTHLTTGQTYDINGWTLTPTGDGLRLRWDVTGHGMLVSPSGNVQAF